MHGNGHYTYTANSVSSVAFYAGTAKASERVGAVGVDVTKVFCAFV